MNKETIKIGAEEFTYDILKKECLAIEMMPVAGNEERLASMPHIRFFDIAATYHFVITLGGAKFDLRITNELFWMHLAFQPSSFRRMQWKMHQKDFQCRFTV